MGLGVEIYDQNGVMRMNADSRFTNVLGYFEIPALLIPDGKNSYGWTWNGSNYTASGYHADSRVNEGELFYVPMCLFSNSGIGKDGNSYPNGQTADFFHNLPNIFKNGNGISWEYNLSEVSPVGGYYNGLGAYKVAYGVF